MGRHMLLCSKARFLVIYIANVSSIFYEVSSWTEPGSKNLQLSMQKNPKRLILVAAQPGGVSKHSRLNQFY